MKTAVTVETKINAPGDSVWRFFTHPEHIKKWYSPGKRWQVAYVENDFRLNGKFIIKLSEEVSGSHYFEGVYTHIQENKLIEFTMIDERKVKVIFSSQANVTKISLVFEANDVTTVSVQRDRWQAILNNFRDYVESNYQPVKVST